MTKQTVLDRMPLGGVRRVEDRPQTPPEPSAQRHQVFLEAQRTRGLGSAGIEGQQDLLRVWIMLGTIFNRTRDEAGGPASLSSWYRHTTPVRCYLLIKKPSFSVIIGARIEPSFRASNSALWVKKRGKWFILSVGIIPYGNTLHASYVRRCLFPSVLKLMRFV